MAGTTAPSSALSAEELARAAAECLLSHVDSDADDPTLYHGRAGVAIALQEAYVHFGDERYRTATERTVSGWPWPWTRWTTTRCTSGWPG